MGVEVVGFAEQEEQKERVLELKRARGAVVLAHNYQIDEVQDIADFVGDSLALSQQAAATAAEIIVFCGVHFMAESAAILAPEKTVLLPDLHAGCPLANTITPETLRQKKAQFPKAQVVCYVNSSAAVKAASDICCTSSNAVDVVNSLPGNQVLMVPDRNLAHFVARQTDKEIISWDGCCVTHQRVTAADVATVRRLYPEAPVIVHPECRPEVVDQADFVASTSGLIRYARESKAPRIVVGTEMGIFHRLRQDSPQKEFLLLSQGLVCPNMKKTTLAKIVTALETLSPRVTVPEETRVAALGTLERMLALA